MALRAAAAILLVASACRGGEDPAPARQPAGTVAVDGEVANDRGSLHVGPGGEVVVEAGDYFFAPTVLTGAVGLDRDVEVRNVGSVRHNISIPGLRIDEDLEPGAATTLVVAFPESGSTVFFCRFHRARGMLGALVAT
ncbi:MAG TPA: cupredoxin domain-containing protein [Actinomycetota bacterium]|nr:cupredoxin domain-containing protein [Actinomycetota bacterium]